MNDPTHNRARSVVCQPMGRWRRLFGGGIAASDFLSTPIDDSTIFRFSNAASALMAERARHTFTVLEALRQEFADLELPVMAKLGYGVDGGDPNDKEHLWFEVHDVGSDWIDGKLVNQPYSVSRLHPGDRGRHPASLLSDWMILTPFGQISPRSLQSARELRERHQEIAARLREERGSA